MKTRLLRQGLMGGLLGLSLLLHGTAQAADPASAEELLATRCVACHQAEGGDKYSRISHQRKTPEGWLMTIARMQTAHDVPLTDEERRTLVKYLADRQGMAPSETADYRYALERRLNQQETLMEDPQLGEMCVRCHSGGRVAMQGRTEQEWHHLVNFHLGHWPALEYQALSRDRDWLNIALNETVPHLAKRFPLESEAWFQWMEQRPSAESLASRWVFRGHYTGKGEVAGSMTANYVGDDSFEIKLDGRYANGEPFTGSGTALLHNGHEWRANVDIDGTILRQVFSVVDNEMTGRMFERDRDERGLDFHAVAETAPTLLAVQPGYVKVGQEQELTLIGSGLNGTPQLGAGIEVLKVLDSSADRMRVQVRVAADAPVGVREVAVGEANGTTLAVYRQISEVRVVPDYAVARIGGNGSPTEKVEGRFDAEAWGLSEDGKTPYRIGFVPATWSVEPFDEEAEQLEDVKFAGVMDRETGVFIPGDAGPNPQRPMMANNVGNLKVLATVEEDGQAVTGEGQMIVGVQRWVIPPIP
ncbi:quinohemoprotein amine dehydrogenase subunit alpha [Pseudomonas sp. MYb185]|uniref:quinohemoprotein amine dehydrogenase subunit alpha n=1 Tax=Pseudomonas sp. MYb185 TaxID=1848729 RepID=UPI000CFAAEBB|nr:quinohemoprotein amine dehydrogenase subunit alpha [Pseudomonas sp. MYb185]PRB84605.1 quinohemoprotein amine dehydrogenase subunit alpha [Pseudomonas sp. MYb185]